MSRLSGQVADRLAARIQEVLTGATSRPLSQQLSNFGVAHASDIRDLVREARRLASDIEARTGRNRIDDRWAEIEVATGVGRNPAAVRRWAEHCAEATVALLCAQIEEMEDELLMLSPRPSLIRQ